MEDSEVISHSTILRLKQKNQLFWWLNAVSDVWFGKKFGVETYFLGFVMWSLMIELVPSIYALSLEGALSALSVIAGLLFFPSVYHFSLAIFTWIKSKRAKRISETIYDDDTQYDDIDLHRLETNVDYMKSYINLKWSTTATVITLLRKPFFYIVQLMGVVSNFNFIGQEVRVVMIGMGVGAAWTQLSCSMRDISFDKGRSMSNRRGERQIWSVLLGWLLLLYFRFGYASLSPLFLGDHGWPMTTGVVLVSTVLISFIVLEELITHFVEIDEPLQVVDESRHVMEVDPNSFMEDSPDFEPELNDNHNRQKFVAGLQFGLVALSRGLALGSLLFITHWLFTSSSIIPRWAMLPAYPYNILILLAATLGVIIANVSNILKSVIGSIMLIMSACVLSFVPNNHNLVTNILVILCLGGFVMATVLPSMWIVTLDVRSHAGSDLSLGITMLAAATIYFAQIAVTTMFVTIPEIPWTHFAPFLQHMFQEKPYICLMMSSSLITAGLRRLLIRRPRLKIQQHESKSRTIPTANRRMLTLLIVLIFVGFIPSMFVRLLGVPSRFSTEPNISEEAIIERNFKFLSFNVRQGFGLNKRNNFRSIEKIIVQSGAQVIGLQESDTTRIISGNCDLMEYLSFHTNMYEYYGPSPRDCTLGASALSSIPIMENQFHILPSSVHKSLLLELTLDTSTRNESRKMYFFNAYFSTTERDQLEQVKKTAEVLLSAQPIEKDMFLVGDLNLSPNSTILRSFVEMIPMTDSVGYISQKQKASRRPTTSGNCTIDYIFYKLKDEKKTRIVNATVLQSGDISDHFPVYATFVHEET
jgi:endonuclease/exonuclease/phosphatase family metal-dependent hydrolase